MKTLIAALAIVCSVASAQTKPRLVHPNANPYAEVTRLNATVDTLDKRWRSEVESAQAEFAGRYKASHKPMPAQLPADLVQRLLTENLEIIQTFRTVASYIDVNRTAAARYMKMTPHQAEADQKAYDAATAAALTPPKIADLERNFPEEDQFAPMEQYLSNLAAKLGDLR